MNKSMIFKESLSEIAQRFPNADPKVLIELDKFATAVSHSKIAFADKNASGRIWDRISVLQSFHEVFDPILIGLAPYGSDNWEALSFNQIELPSSEALLTKSLNDQLNTIEHCIIFAKKIEGAVDTLEDQFTFQPHKTLELRTTGESLLAISAVLRAIYQSLQPKKIRWCKACFRRAHQELDYCNLHYSSRDSSSQDTANKKAKRIAKSIEASLFEKWERHRARRRLAGDNIILFSTNEPVIEFEQTAVYMKVPDQAIQLVNATRDIPWSEIAFMWDAVIDSSEEVRKLFILPAKNYPDWDAFVKALFSSLNDIVENTRHPLWVLYIIGEAEEWFKLEIKMSDRRKNNTKEKVVEMHLHGKSIDEIAILLGIGEKYVKKLLPKD